VHALRVLAARNGRSAEAEIRDILERAVKPARRVGLGDALAALGRKVGLSDEDIAAIDQTRDKSPSNSKNLNDRARHQGDLRGDEAAGESRRAGLVE
jgi:plasmid stability protein